eukprot:CAMPEP_0118929234 /NCGR_PEP_ID=MMETSP1169-20130426/6289_1 /TAXON_ID=36882 /ORGANISM="Pyramimonas obovata, Strain CCMP722" /LENGTH=346 /DNA_ID=CAMNT_0006871385 /DNA_START=8 /DNA_END=1045 /DNA_ORIENTATION=+
MTIRGLVLLAALSWSSAQRQPPCFRGMPYTYSPLLSEEGITQEPDAAACQARCAGVSGTSTETGCKYFSFAESDMLCSLHPPEAVLLNTTSISANVSQDLRTSGDTACCIKATGCDALGSLTCGEQNDTKLHVDLGGVEAYARLATILERELTVMAWVKGTHFKPEMVIVGSLFDDFFYDFGWSLGTTRFIGPSFQFRVKSEKYPYLMSIESKHVIAVDRWYHVAATYKDNQGFSEMRLFVDRELEASSSRLGGRIVYEQKFEHNTFQMFGGDDQNEHRPWVGLASHVALYDVALEPSAIREFALDPLMLPSANDTHLVAGYVFQEGPALLADVTGEYPGQVALSQ